MRHPRPFFPPVLFFSIATDASPTLIRRRHSSSFPLFTDRRRERRYHLAVAAAGVHTHAHTSSTHRSSFSPLPLPEKTQPSALLTRNGRVHHLYSVCLRSSCKSLVSVCFKQFWGRSSCFRPPPPSPATVA